MVVSNDPPTSRSAWDASFTLYFVFEFCILHLYSVHFFFVAFSFSFLFIFLVNIQHSHGKFWICVTSIHIQYNETIAKCNYYQQDSLISPKKDFTFKDQFITFQTLLPYFWIFTKNWDTS